jgi:hypothetical protein
MEDIILFVWQAQVEIATRGTKHPGDFCPNRYQLGQKSLDVGAPCRCLCS